MELVNNVTAMKCYKIPGSVVGNLKISYDTTSSKIVFWSMYQLYIYEELNFVNPVVVETEFEIADVIILNNHLICLDRTGNVNICESCIIWSQNIISICLCETLRNQYVICLKSVESDSDGKTLLVNDFSVSDSPDSFTEQYEMPNEDWMRQGEKPIMKCAEIGSKYSEGVQRIFNIVARSSDYLLLIISMDKRNVYAVLFPKQQNNVNSWIKLHRNHTDIVDIKIILTNEILIFIGLTGGNIIKITLLCNTRKPEVCHLNTTINKFTIISNAIIYSDMLTMWRNENAFSESQFKFKQFKVRNVRDYCLIKDQIICITFSNLIYTFNVNHNSSYILSDPNETCSVENITNSDCLQEIIKTVKMNEDVSRRINQESGYLMALSLSKRPDIMDDLIKVSASVFHDYGKFASYQNLSLTEELHSYCNSKTYYFLVNVLVNKLQHKLNKLLSDVLGDIKIHITLSEHAVLKTTSVLIKEQFKTTNFLIPLKRKNRDISRMQVSVMIITSVPGMYDENQKLWTILYHKCIYLSAENFINVESSKNILLKEDDKPLDMVIYNRAKLQHPEYEFHICEPVRYEWAFYVNLSELNLKKIEDVIGLIDPTSSTMAYNSFSQLVKTFKGKKMLDFQVGKERVTLNIDCDSLKVSCKDVTVAWDIRNFFSKTIFSSNNTESGNRMIDHQYYTIIENLKRDMNNYVGRRVPKNEFAIFVCSFLRNLYCLLPI